MSSETLNGRLLQTGRPIILSALSAAYTVYLVQNADPRLRNSSIWLPLSLLFVLWISVAGIPRLLNRPGASWSASWASAGLSFGDAAKGEEDWQEAAMQGGLVSVSLFAWVRTFVGLDAASAIAFLSLTISLGNMEIFRTRISAVSLIGLVSSAIAIAISASKPVTSLHHRAYSLAMCVAYIVSSAYLAHRSGTNTATTVAKTLSGRKAAIMAMGATSVLTSLFAVNEMERMLPSKHAVFFIVSAAIASTIATLSSASSTVDKAGSAIRQGIDHVVAKGLACTACLLLVAAPASHRESATLLLQAFVFTVGTAAAWIYQPESLASLITTSTSSIMSRSSSSTTLANPPESETNPTSPDKRPKAMADPDIEASRGHDSSEHLAALDRSSGLSGERWRMACFGIVLLPMLAWIGRHAAVLIGAAQEQSMSVKSFGWQREADYDIVVAYYDEDKTILKETIQSVKSRLQKYHTSRTIIYAKGPDSHTLEGLDGLRKAVGADEVVALKNVGREGETYLNHITRHYDSIVAPLAHQTFFIQPHFAWDWIFAARMENVVSDATGFVSFGPYLNASCTADGSEIDSHGQSHPRIAQIYSAFQGDLCPADGFAITWAGQFMASRRRIQLNKLSTYKNLLEFFHVPKLEENDPAYESTRKEWIWKEGWWNSQPSDPTLGHAVERSWCAMMRCSDLEMALKCQGENESNPEFCQCLDDGAERERTYIHE